jgi:hypothetical protein
MPSRARFRASRFSFAIALFLAAASAHAGAGVTPSDATPVQREEAQTHFGRGRELYAAKRFDEAAAEFERSYAIVASPNALFFLARCDRERGRLVAAYAELGRTAAEAREHAAEDPRYAKTAQAASEERDAIAPLLGFVTVTVTGGSADTTVTVAGAKFPRVALGEPVPVMPGSTEVVVETPGKAPLRRSVVVAAGERKTLALDAGTVDAVMREQASAPSSAGQGSAPPGAEAPSNHGALRTWSYVSAGVAVAGIATFAIAGTLSNAAYSDLQTRCSSAACPATDSNSKDEINRGKTEQTLANVGLVVGLVGAAAAVTFFVVSIPSRADKVAVVAGPTSIGLRGNF